MTDFDLNTELRTLGYLTGGFPSPLGNYTHDLIRAHAEIREERDTLADRMSKPTADLAAENDLLKAQIEVMHAGITVDAVIGPPTINDYAELDDLTPRERAMREVVDQYATKNDRLIADRDHMAVVFGQALNALDPDQYAGLRARIVLCIASTQVDANTH